MCEQDLMGELSGILDELNGLPSDAFAERSALRTRQGELRSELAALQADDLEKLKSDWNAQAAHKAPERLKPAFQYEPDSTLS